MASSTVGFRIGRWCKAAGAVVGMRRGWLTRRSPAAVRWTRIRCGAGVPRFAEQGPAGRGQDRQRVVGASRACPRARSRRRCGLTHKETPGRWVYAVEATPHGWRRGWVIGKGCGGQDLGRPQPQAVEGRDLSRSATTRGSRRRNSSMSFGLYLNPPTRAGRVFCFDEKDPSARRWTAPSRRCR